MKFDFDFMIVALKAALKYTPITLIMAFVPLVIGTFFGTLIAVVRLFKIKVIHRIAQVFVVVTKGIPVILTLMIVFFVVVQGLDAFAKSLNLGFEAKDVDLIYVVITALSLFAIATISEIMRGALYSVGSGQYEAAYSIGLTRLQALRRIALPQAFPVAAPMLCSSFIGLIKGSSLAFMVSVTDLMHGALITATSNYNFLEAYIAAAIVYWALCFIVERLAGYLEKRLSIFKKESVL